MSGIRKRHREFTRQRQQFGNSQGSGGGAGGEEERTRQRKRGKATRDPRAGGLGLGEPRHGVPTRRGLQAAPAWRTKGPGCTSRGAAAGKFRSHVPGGSRSKSCPTPDPPRGAASGDPKFKRGGGVGGSVENGVAELRPQVSLQLLQKLAVPTGKKKKKGGVCKRNPHIS